MPTVRKTKRQARKRQRQSDERNLRNRAVRTRVRKQMRQLRGAAEEGDTAKVQELLPATESVIDVGARKGVLHPNTAARYKSRMARKAATARPE